MITDIAMNDVVVVNEMIAVVKRNEKTMNVTANNNLFY
jgi:hypothetical protein